MDINIQMIWSAGLTIGMAACGWFISLGGKLLNQIQANYSAQIAQHDEQLLIITNKLDDQNQAFYEFQLRVQREFVSKQDHLHSAEKLDAKVDNLSTLIHKIDKNVTRIAAGQGVEYDE